jgi:hypothetical protein
MQPRCQLIKEKYMRPREKCSLASSSPLSTIKEKYMRPPREMFSLTAVRVPAGERPLHLSDTNHLAELAKFTIVVLNNMICHLFGYCQVSTLSQFYSRNNNLCITHRLSVKIYKQGHSWSRTHAKKVFLKVWTC